MAYRSLPLGPALLPRPAGVWLARQLARRRGPGVRARAAGLPLRRLLDWLGDALRRGYRERRALDLGQPPPLPERRQP